MAEGAPSKVFQLTRALRGCFTGGFSRQFSVGWTDVPWDSKKRRKATYAFLYLATGDCALFKWSLSTLKIEDSNVPFYPNPESTFALHIQVCSHFCFSYAFAIAASQRISPLRACLRGLSVRVFEPNWRCTSSGGSPPCLIVLSRLRGHLVTSRGGCTLLALAFVLWRCTLPLSPLWRMRPSLSSPFLAFFFA